MDKACWFRRYPVGQEGACDVLRLRYETAFLSPGHKGWPSRAGEAKQNAVLTTAKKAADNQATIVTSRGTGSLERRPKLETKYPVSAWEVKLKLYHIHIYLLHLSRLLL